MTASLASQIAAALLVVIGLVHSILGEKRLIAPLLAQPGLPVISGDVSQTRRVLRTAWHITTAVWLLMAANLVYLSTQPGPEQQIFCSLTAVLFGASGLLSLIASKGRHPSWPFFLAISGLTGFSAATL